jgi:hypothetical protein
MTFLFDHGPHFSPSDIEPLQGDGERVRSAGRMLQDAAGALDFAQRAAGQLQTLTDGISWRGAAFQAFKGNLEKQPLPEHLVNARNVLGWTGDELGRLATKLDDIQADFGRLRQRADLLGVDGDVPEERRAEVDAIKQEYEDLKERRKQALNQAAAVFDEMTEKTVFARPPPSGWRKFGKALGGALHFTKEFAIGLGEGVVEMGKGLAMIAYLATPMGMWKAGNWLVDNRHIIKQAITYAIHDPIGMATEIGKVVVDYETLRQSPGRWLGKLAPGIAVAVATAGMGGVAGRSSAIAARAHEAEKGLSRIESLSERSKFVTNKIERIVPSAGHFGPTADLTVSQAFRKGILDTFVNRPLRNAATGGVYGRITRAQYLAYGRKTTPLWGKLTKHVPNLAAQGGRISAQEGLTVDITGTVRDGAEQVQAEEQAQAPSPPRDQSAVGGG